MILNINTFLVTGDALLSDPYSCLEVFQVRPLEKNSEGHLVTGMYRII
jgi:hypothetical protein